MNEHDGFRCYLLLCGALTLLMVVHTRNGHWIGDFWEHSAVIRELATHPIAPRHPQLLIDAPHIFVTPYTVTLGWLVRVTKKSPISILASAGIFNLFLLLWSFRRFVRTLEFGEEAAWLALTFMILLWGSDPWSGSVLTLSALAYSLPYPTTFATALVLLCFSLAVRFMNTGRRGTLLALLAGGSPLLIVHPLSALALYSGLGALALADSPQRPLQGFLLLATIVFLSLALAAAWPFFPVIEFLKAPPGEFHEANRVMYQQLLKRTWPAWIGGACIVHRLRSDHRDRLAWMALVFAAVYAAGALTHRWALGRVMLYLFLTLDLALGAWIWEAHRSLVAPRLRTLFALGETIAVLGLLGWSSFNFKTTFLEIIPGRPTSYATYEFLSHYTGQYDVILADIKTSWLVPTFGGKIVAAKHPLAFVPDQEQRRKDVERFFNPSVPEAERQAILAKYRVDYVLIDLHNRRMRPILRFARSWGEPVYSSDQWLLIRNYAKKA